MNVFDPVASYPRGFNFKSVHYFHKVPWSAKAGEYTWLVWDEGEETITKYGYFLDSEGYEQEEQYSETFKKVKGMIELQRSPYDENVIWLTYFEVTNQFKGQGFSKTMIQELVKFFKEKFPNKKLLRSSASDEGALKLKDNFTAALDLHQINYGFSS